MKRIATIALICALPIALTVPALAHHSAAAYNTQQRITVKGSVVKFQFKNPHVYMTLEVTKDDGTKSTMEVEAGAASVLNGLGFTSTSLKVGDVVSIVGNPGRNNPDTTMLGLDLFKQDANSTYLPLNIASRSVYEGKVDASAMTIAGTWFAPRAGFNGFLGGTRNWTLTDKAKAERNNDPKATTQKDCIPIGEPALMFYPVANKIEVEKDKVILKTDWMDTERTVYMDGRKHPAATQTSLHGHSVGHWEGKALVVETTNFAQHAMGNSTGVPGSTQKKLTEKFALSEDGRTLQYSGTLEDPVYLAQPVQFSGNWEYRPTMPFSNQKCDVEVARRFLTQ
jgi:hypothetical protein